MAVCNVDRRAQGRSGCLSAPFNPISASRELAPFLERVAQTNSRFRLVRKSALWRSGLFLQTRWQCRCGDRESRHNPRIKELVEASTGAGQSLVRRRQSEGHRDPAKSDFESAQTGTRTGISTAGVDYYVRHRSSKRMDLQANPGASQHLINAENQPVSINWDARTLGNSLSETLEPTSSSCR